LVGEVVIDRDVRAPALLAAGSLVSRYAIRRSAGVLLLVALDTFGIICAVTLAPLLARQLFGTSVHRPPLHLIVVGSIVTLVAFAFEHLYGLREQRRGARRVLRASLWAIAALIALRFCLGSSVSLLPLALISVLAVACIIAERATYDVVLEGAFAQRLHDPRAIFADSPEHWAQVNRALHSPHDQGNYRVVGMVDEGFAPWRGQADDGAPALGRPADLERIIACVKPDEVIVADPNRMRSHLPAMIAICRRRHVVLRLASIEPGAGPGAVTYVPGCGVPVYVVQSGAPGGLAFIAKRLMDLVLSTIALVLLAPFLACIAVLIKLDSPGPVLYAEQRVGLGQRRFLCYKFRTMAADAATLQAQLEPLNEASGALFKIENDPRVTRPGRLLRRYSLDELPQLVNVLKGDMSLVGPRPLPLRDNDLMSDLHKRRHVVLPGLTGLWQTSGRCSIGYDEMIRLDLRYIETWSFTEDLRILVRTIGAVLFAQGAC